MLVIPDHFLVCKVGGNARLGKSIAETQQDPVSHDIFGKNLELVEKDPPEHRYPRQNRYAPDRFAPTISH